ncbi:hypothetical protein NPA08_04210 [Mycoplasmopsis citelli]|uniref:Uncharacterized protein n=1 Tax=Mycoplasmopsis citelli TaxID=171281 RepID=A0A449B2K7_9BACT|nr:hypothetical protein [Mycoplasmopsis citelli]UUD36125.1 hypothetical protein NPA08_04210 [Mycoplasmopsis citelli]VEU74828.1 Uncharacterised protein [Mycoplasmopsis citelli]
MLKTLKTNEKSLNILKQKGINIAKLEEQLSLNLSKYSQIKVKRLNELINLNSSVPMFLQIQALRILSNDGSIETFNKISNILDEKFDDYQNQKDEYMANNSIMLGSNFKTELNQDLNQNGIETRYSYVFNDILNCDDDTYYSLNDTLNGLSKETWEDFKSELLDSLLDEVGIKT